MRRSSAFFLWTAGLVALSGLAAGHALHRERAAGPGFEERRLLVRRLELTDLCLFTEASYTRHPSQADSFTAFQDHPLAFEHFPSGSIVPPARIRKRAHVQLD